MPPRLLFVVSRDRRDLEWVSQEAPEGLKGRLCGFDEVDEVRELISHEDPAAILLGAGTGLSPDEVCRALWVASQGRRPIPVVILAPRYEVQAALLCFRLGVSDYLGRVEHRDRLRVVLDELIGGRERARLPIGSIEGGLPSRRFAALAD